MWPKVPKDISKLSIAELATLSNELRDFLLQMLKPETFAELSDEDKAKVAALRTQREEIKALHETKKAEKVAADAQAAADKAALDALEAEGALSDDDTAPVDDDPADAPDPDAPPADDESDAPDPDASTPSKELALVGSKPAKVQTKMGTGSKPAAGGTGVLTADSYLKVLRGVEGKQAGDTFEDWAELAAAAVKKSESMAANDTTRYPLAMIKGNFPAERKLTDDMMLNAAKFDTSDAEVMAAWCAPATPYYNLACMNTTRRPVFNSLPGFEAPRGRVSIMASPSLSDITGGFGDWTNTDDANGSARKTCITVQCGSPTTFEMYGVWRCLTVKNMLAMTYPELVEAWLNRLHAAQARLGETLLLDAMSSVATDINAPALGYGAAVTITSTILNYLALYQETQRWDLAGNMKAWIPRWVLWGMKMDFVRRRTDDGQIHVPSDADIERMFRDVGVDVTWFIDTPTWAVAIPVVGAANLNLIPQSVQILIAPPDKFALIDRGNLNIGVTGDNRYRDNDSNSQNQFTFFFESFEGIVSATTCPAHILDIPVCWTGVQISDIVINCQGGDEVGSGS